MSERTAPTTAITCASRIDLLGGGARHARRVRLAERALVDGDEVDAEVAHPAARLGDRELRGVDHVAPDAARRVGHRGVDGQVVADDPPAGRDGAALRAAAGQRRGGGQRGQDAHQPSSRTVSSCEYGGAQQHRSTRSSSPGFHSLCGTPGRDDDGVARPHLGLLGAQAHAPGAGGEVVDLLGLAVVVLDRLAARRHGRLRERLVDGVAGGHAGELADGGAVGGDERLALFEADGLHEAVDRVDDTRAREAPPALSSAGGAT